MKHQMRKRITAIILCLVLLLSSSPVMAKGNPTSGKWKKNVSWKYDKKTATLTVSGTGYMEDAGSCCGDNPGWLSWDVYAKKIIITGSLKNVSECAFSDFRNVKTIEMCDSITKIEAYAFDMCDSLKTIKFSKNLKKIGDGAFSDTGIKQISLPESAFQYSGIQKITIPSKVKVIGKRAFSTCNQLKSICIKSKVISEMDEDAFVDISPKAKITVPKSKYGFYCELLKINIPENVKVGKNRIRIG